jgi:hypothetical protein
MSPLAGAPPADWSAGRGRAWGAPAAALIGRWLTGRGSDSPATSGYRLQPHPLLDGLEEFVLRSSPHETADRPPAAGALLLGTVRMGYGHYRFALAAADAARAQGLRPLWLDLGALEDPASRLLHRVNRLYSGLSRLSADSGGPADRLWERLTASGDWNALRLSVELAPHFTHLLDGLDRGLVFLSSFAWVGHIAVAAGFERVIHLVHDNAPMPFVAVPGALNLVQSPSMYAGMRRLGVPAAALELAGHWVGQRMARSAEQLSQLRLERLKRAAPRRLLIPIGGAGSQVELIERLLEHLAPALRDGRCRVLLNCGDHAAACRRLQALLARLDLPQRLHTDWPAARDRAAGLQLTAAEPAAPAAVELFQLAEPLAGVELTDRLLSACDLLLSKPSELAFLPLPKLMLRRVGQHEAYGAIRAAELGDGTPECRDWSQTRFFLDALIHGDDLLAELNAGVSRAARAGVYDGAIRAVQRAARG